MQTKSTPIDYGTLDHHEVHRLTRRCAFSGNSAPNGPSSAPRAAFTLQNRLGEPKNEVDNSSASRVLAMLSRFAVCSLLLLVSLRASASDAVEALLLHKFAVQNKIDAEKTRAFVNDATSKAKELKDVDPDRGIDVLRAAANRLDGVKALSTTDRRALIDLVQPLMQELRDTSLLKRRELASRHLEAFKEYLEISGYEGRNLGRSGSDHWEPAVFMSPDGQSQYGKLIALGKNVTHRFTQKELNAALVLMPLIQVFGGFYVFDRANSNHVFLTNREFYDSVWSRLAREYETADLPGKRALTAAESARAADKVRLRASIESGEFFLRSLPNLEPIAGVGDDEDAFLAFVGATLAYKGLPVPVDQIYARELRERLVGFSPMQWSAARRTLFLLKAKDTAISPLFVEIMRDETTKLLKTEYAGFTESDANRAVLYVFSKLK
jgi:hypothetical protein